MTISFTVKGRPVPKARPRVTGGRAYTPAETREYEEWVRWNYARANGPKFAGWVTVFIRAYFPIPESTPKKRAAELEGGYCAKRVGDVDNVAKSILDALNGVAYTDDCQVVGLDVQKLQSATPRVEVDIVGEVE